jgi:hypothetical protein
MATENLTEYNLPADAYANFDATSVRDLIVSKLIDDGVYTDQIFEGSNMSSLIDVLSYTYHLLLFYLNNTASESMFSDAEIYENINRIVKLLNYNPTGGLTSSVSFTSDATGLNAVSYTIPRYTFTSIGTTKYSFTKDIEFAGNTANTIGANNLLYEGVYKSQTVTATGEDFEIITITQPEDGFIDFNNIDIYISTSSTTGYLQYDSVPSLFLHSPVDLVYEKRLNESGDIELKFGNNVTGRSLNNGEIVDIFYLKSSGVSGMIGPNALNSAPKTLYYTPTVKDILSNTGKTYITASDLKKLQFVNASASITPSEKESVADIKRNAVQSFKSQSRLTTAADYEVYIKSKFGEIISDVTVVSNKDFISGYLKYIDEVVIGSSPGFESRLLFNHSKFSSATTFNNIYAFIKPRTELKTTNNTSISFASSSQKSAIKSSVDLYKSVTTDVTLVDPVYIALDFGIQLPGEALTTKLTGKTQLIVTKDPRSLKSSPGIKDAILKVITDSFEITTTPLGSSIKLAAMIESMVSIEGVQTVKMSRTDEEYTFNGLSFLAWNPVYPDNDISIVRQDITFDNFKAPYIFDTTVLYNNIIVV